MKERKNKLSFVIKIKIIYQYDPIAKENLSLQSIRAVRKRARRESLEGCRHVRQQWQ